MDTLLPRAVQSTKHVSGDSSCAYIEYPSTVVIRVHRGGATPKERHATGWVWSEVVVALDDQR